MPRDEVIRSKSPVACQGGSGLGRTRTTTFSTWRSTSIIRAASRAMESLLAANACWKSGVSRKRSVRSSMCGAWASRASQSCFALRSWAAADYRLGARDATGPPAGREGP